MKKIVLFFISVILIFLFKVEVNAQSLTIALECKSLKVGNIQFLKHLSPIKFNAHIGAYYYWRVVFANVSSEEFYTKETTYYQFVINNQLVNEGLNHKAILQRRLYPWEDWKTIYEDPTFYAIDKTAPTIEYLEPFNGASINLPTVTFKWKAYDAGIGLHSLPYFLTLYTTSREEILNSGWINSNSFTTSKPLKPGTYIWNLKVRDLDDNITISSFNSFVVNSSEPPKINKIEAWGINSNIGFTNTSEIKIKIEATDNFGITHYYVSENSTLPSIDSNLWQSIGDMTSLYIGIIPFKINIKSDNLIAQNNFSYKHPIYIWLKDLENNVSSIKSYELTVDLMPPFNTNIIINSNALYTLQREVKIQLDATDNLKVSGYLIKENNQSQVTLDDLNWVNDNNFKRNQIINYVLSSEKGLKTLYVWFRDNAGNISICKSSSIYYDDKPPVNPIIGSIDIKNSALTTNTSNITLILNATGSYNNQITGYYIKENDNTKPHANDIKWEFINPPQEKISIEKNYKILSNSGTVEIYVWFKDNYNNISDGYKKEILYDVKKPIAFIKLLDNKAWYNNEIVDIEISGYDDTQIVSYLLSVYCFDQNTLNNISLWQDLNQPSKNFSLKTKFNIFTINGERIIYLWLKDIAGNISEASKVSLKFDNQAPIIGKCKYVITNFAGSVPGYAEGPIHEAKFNIINGIFANSNGDVYVAEKNNYRVRIIKNDMVSTFVGTGYRNLSSQVNEENLNIPLCVYEDYYKNVLIGDGHLIKIAKDNGKNVTRFAGYDYKDPKLPDSHSSDEPNLEVRPYLKAEFGKIGGITMDMFGNIYVADSRYIRKLKDNMVYVLSGQNRFSSVVEGIASDISYENIGGITSDPIGNIYFTDSSAHCIRRLTSDGFVKIVAGKYKVPGNVDGYLTQNLLNTPLALAMDKIGTIYFTDYMNKSIRILTPDTYVKTIVLESAETQLIQASAIAIMPDNSIIISEQFQSQLKKITINYEKGLELNKIENNVAKIILTVSDNYSKVSSYYVSTNSNIPSPFSTGWVPLNYTGGEQTFEIQFPILNSNINTIYVWVKDNANNISNYETLSLSNKSLNYIGELNISENLNSPSALAVDKYDNLYISDLSLNPIKIITPSNQIYKIGKSGLKQDELNNIKTLAISNENISVLENNKNRITILDDSNIVEIIEPKIDLRLNYIVTKSTTNNNLKTQVIDKYSNLIQQNFNNFSISYHVLNDNFIKPASNFVPHKIELYSDNNYINKIEEPISIFKNPIIYVKVYGSGTSNDLEKEVILAYITSSFDNHGILLELIETTNNSNVFIGKLNLNQNLNLDNNLMLNSESDCINFNFYTCYGVKTFKVITGGYWQNLNLKQVFYTEGAVSIKICNGILYVAFCDSNNDKKISVIKYENEKWEYVGKPGFSNGEVKEIVLDILNSKPCVFYTDNTNEGKGIVKWFNNNKWETLGNNFITPSNAEHLSMSIKDLNNIFVAYSNTSNNKRIDILKYNYFQNNWQPFTTFGITSAKVDNISIICTLNSLYVLVRDSFKAGFLVYKYENNQWIPLTSEAMQRNCQFIKLYVYNEIPYVLYTMSASGLLYLMKFQNNQWINVGSGPISSGRVLSNNITFLNDVPYVIFNDTNYNSKVFVKRFIDGEWQTIGNNLSDSIALFVSIDSFNLIPYVAFFEQEKKHLKVLKYER